MDDEFLEKLEKAIEKIVEKKFEKVLRQLEEINLDNQNSVSRLRRQIALSSSGPINLPPIRYFYNGQSEANSITNPDMSDY